MNCGLVACCKITIPHYRYTQQGQIQGRGPGGPDPPPPFLILKLHLLTSC